MGTTLTGKLIADTYDALLKVTDNNVITGIKKRMTDGFGNDTPLLISTTDVQVDGNFLTESVQFNTATLQTADTVGKLAWNDNDGTLDLRLKGGNVTLQVGQEQVIRVVNKTGTNLLEANYQVVRVDGAQGNRLKIALAQANNDANSAETLGLVTETINDNQEGFVTTSGIVRNINTTGSLQGETWADGNMLYLSGTTAGRLTNVKPAAPTHTVIMGYVVRAHATQGQIFVKVDNGYELDELHNVLITSPLNNQALVYESATGLWKNQTIATGVTSFNTRTGAITLTSGDVTGALGFTPVTNARTLTINGTTFDLSADRSWTITTGLSGSGTTNYVSKFTGTTSLGNSLIFDDGTNVGIATSTPSSIGGHTGVLTIFGSNATAISLQDSVGRKDIRLNDGNLDITNSAGTSHLYVANAGGVGIGSTTLTGFNLNIARNLTGAVTSRGIQQAYTVQSDVTNAAIIYSSGISTQATAFTLPQLTHYFASQGTIGAGSTVTNQNGFRVDNTLIGATNNYAFKGEIPAGTNRWNLFMDGTANNYLAGNTAIGTTTPFSSAGYRTLTVGGGAGILGQIVWNSGTTPIGYAYNDSTNMNIGSNADLIFRTTVSATERMRITSGGNVGIGTSAPSAKLDIQGNTSTTGSTIYKDVTTSILLVGRDADMYGGSNSDGGVFVYGANKLHLSTNSARRLTVDGSGNVGIGTTLPKSISSGLSLTIGDGATQHQPFLALSRNATGGFWSGIRWYDGDTVRSVIQEDSDFNLRFSTLNTERMRITSGGDVAIGTSSVFFPAAGRTNLIVNGGTSSIFALGVGNSYAAYLYAEASRVELSTATQPLTIVTNGAERMRITSGGLVGIGTSLPAFSLDTVSPANAQQAIRISNQNSGSSAYSTLIAAAFGNSWGFRVGSSAANGNNLDFVVDANNGGTSRMTITPGGNVGIGTSSPVARLTTIVGASATDVHALEISNQTDASFAVYLRNNITTLSAGGAGNMIFASGTTERMRITSGGNVGIGTSAADERLTIRAGNIKLYSLQNSPNEYRYIGTEFDSGNGNNRAEIRFAIDGSDTFTRLTFHTANGVNTLNERMRITSGGNVGIGTSSPVEILDIRNAYREPTSGEFTQLIGSTTTQDLGRGGSLGFTGFTNGTSGFTSFSGIKGAKENGDGGNTAGNMILYTRPNAGAMTERMRITSTGNVGIGTTSPSALLHLVTDGAAKRALRISGIFSDQYAEIQIAGNSQEYRVGVAGSAASVVPGSYYVYHMGSDSIRFCVNPSGNIGIGTNTPGYRLDVVGTIYASGDVLAFSDISVKENIRPIDNALERVLNSRGVVYDRIDNEEKDNIGFIAQELEVNFPELVSTKPDGTKSVKYQNAVAVMFEAIKELTNRVVELESRLN